MSELISKLLTAMQTSGSPFETEHALVMLLLLYGLLTYREAKLTRWAFVAIIAGILLALITPFHGISLIWPVVTGLVVPPFLWQGAVEVTKSGPLRHRWGPLVWLVALGLVTLSLHLLSSLPFSTALLLAMLVVTLVWYLRELNVERTYLSTLGQIALVVLIVEIDLGMIPLRPWLGTLFSGIAVGIAIGLLGIYIYRKLKQYQWKNLFFFAWAYVAYLAGIAFGTSAIAATLAAALVVATYGFSIGLWLGQKDIPVPSNTPFFFYLSAGAWLLLGWQAHTTVALDSLVGIPAVLVVIAIGIVVLRKIAPLSSENYWLRLLRQETSVLLLLLGSLILWPREAFLTTFNVEIALLAALLLIILLRISIRPLFQALGVTLAWPVEKGPEE